MVLVDPNGLTDRTYYATIDPSNPSGFVTSQFEGRDSWRIDFTKFTRNGKSDGTAFTAHDFGTVIANHIVAVEDAAGAYKDVTVEVKANSETNYTVYDSKNDKYYLFTTKGEGTSYHLTVDTDIHEDYYISVYVPIPDGYTNQLYYYAIHSPDKLTGDKTASRSVNEPCNILIAQLFTQSETSYTVNPSNEQINVENPSLIVDASTTVKITNTTAKNYLTGVKLYHAFHLLLNRYESDGSVNNEIVGLDPDEVTGSYKLNNGEAVTLTDTNIDLQNGYLNVNTEDLLSKIIAENSNDQVQVSAAITIAFHDLEEFPEKVSEGNIGVNVAASSNLAYDSERLSYTSMSASLGTDSKYYHREAATAASLSYTVKSELDAYDTYGKDSQNKSRQGVNGKTSIGKYNNRTAMEIHSTAVFNAASVEEKYLKDAVYVRYSMTLWKKADTKNNNGVITGTEYERVDTIANYLLGVELKNNKTVIEKSGDATTYVYDLTIDGCETLGPRIYPAYVTFYAITGEGFTEYANYQVQIQAELLNKDKMAIGNAPKDYIVYTNARAYPTVIDQTVLQAQNATP